MFEDVRHELSLIIIPPLTDPEKIKQFKLTDNGIIIIIIIVKNSA